MYILFTAITILIIIVVLFIYYNTKTTVEISDSFISNKIEMKHSKLMRELKYLFDKDQNKAKLVLSKYFGKNLFLNLENINIIFNFDYYRNKYDSITNYNYCNLQMRQNKEEILTIKRISFKKINKLIQELKNK